MTLISVKEAEEIILSVTKVYGTEYIPLSESVGRFLAEGLIADRDLPPFDRVTMDGIATHFDDINEGTYQFRITGQQAAGTDSLSRTVNGSCIEIMTGAALHESFNTVIPYENITIQGAVATIIDSQKVKEKQNIHWKGSDKSKGECLVPPTTRIGAAVVNIAATIGQSTVCVFKHPKVAVITTGGELVPISETPSPTQIRRSNNYAISAALRPYGIIPSLFHVADDTEQIKAIIDKCKAENDVILFTGAVSMGKYDYLPSALIDAGIKPLFHKVLQRPGKPFWFGNCNNGPVVFAFPGNPVSAFLCLHRYFLPWLMHNYKINQLPIHAVLSADVHFNPDLTYFLQVAVSATETGTLLARPVSGNGSGDLANLLRCNGFMELPAEISFFKKGMCFPVWLYGPVAHGVSIA